MSTVGHPQYNTGRTRFKKGNPFGKRFQKGDPGFWLSKKRPALSEKWKKKISLALKGKMPKNIQLLHTSKVIEKAQMKRGNTLPERLFEQELIKQGVDYQKQVPLPESKPISLVDFFLPDSKTVVYVDGDFWHTRNKKVMANDQKHNNYFSKLGYKIFRAWEFEIKDPQKLPLLVEALVYDD